ncbi:hypothetical protein [Priestia megaterium]|uniref:hypothetical protein n=2 Tax=Priestia megaterium TaxID=1404 RepID=UPI0020D263AF|nr:hypothetical protein [Priestia megaterium]MDH2362322.1 hypothetical protein [Priestia megaterium]MED3868951.1 hypothetical protein [Priestia megaterium]
MRIKKLSELTNKSKQRKEKADESKDSKKTSASSTHEEQKLSERVGDNLSLMKKALRQRTDLVVREFRISIEEKFTLGVAYIDGLVKKTKLNTILDVIYLFLSCHCVLCHSVKYRPIV